MSEHCRPLLHPLTSLAPRWVTFTDTKGVLRCLRQNENLEAAHGLVFICPKCNPDKAKRHYVVMLFDLPAVPTGARPHGRFRASQEKDQWGRHNVAPFKSLSLEMVSSTGTVEGGQLRPGDLSCKWYGTLVDGIVGWRPSQADRALRFTSPG